MLLLVPVPRLSVFALALASAVSCFAQTHAEGTLQEVVVTATRSETRVDALISDVAVIDRATIERAAGRSVSELLARTAGVMVSGNGGQGKESSVYIRGTENRHVLLLVDGVRYGSATKGTPNFDTIPLEMIDHIEVLKGPASALYGSDAVGGVVQIFTRKGVSGFHPYASLTAGEWDRSEISTGASGGSGAFSYAFDVQTLSENGFSATNKRLASFNPDRDGFSQNSSHASFGWALTPDWRLHVNGLQSMGTNHYDNGLSAFDVHGDFGTSMLGLALDGSVLPGWKSHLSAGSTADKITSYGSAIPTRFETTQDQLSWQNDVTSPVGLLMLGVESLKESVSSTTPYALGGRTTTSLFVGLSGNAGPHSWQANARQDRNSQFGEANTGLLGYGYALTADWTIRAATGNTFKVPSFNTLYFVDPIKPSNNGNPSTLPETGRNSEVGLRYAVGAQEFSITHFENRIQGFITRDPVVSNIPFVHIEGWTLGAQGAIQGFDYRVGLDFLDARNEATNLKLARRPDTQLTAGLDYATGLWKWGSSFIATSETFDNATNTQSLGGYATLDVHALYALGNDWSVQARVINVGDKFYQTVNGYNQPGRAAYLTVRYQPK